jgi:hypothetical protein
LPGYSLENLQQQQQQQQQQQYIQLKIKGDIGSVPHRGGVGSIAPTTTEPL